MTHQAEGAAALPRDEPQNDLPAGRRTDRQEIGTPTPKTQARIRADLTISAVMIMALRSSRLAGGRR
jgi:hypothetical protein